MDNNKRRNELVEHVVFSLGKEYYAIPTNKVHQIDRYNKANISVLPGMPGYMIGMLLDEGSVLPLISLSVLLGFDEEEYGSIMVVSIKDYTLGLCVKNVLGIKYVDTEGLMSVPDVFDEWRMSLLKGAIEDEGKLIVIMDINNLLGEKKIEEIRKLSAENS